MSRITHKSREKQNIYKPQKNLFSFPGKQDMSKADKLIFHQSDDDGQPQSQEQFDLPMPRSATTYVNKGKDNHHFEFSKESVLLKPSLLRMQQEDCEYLKEDPSKSNKQSSYTQEIKLSQENIDNNINNKDKREKSYKKLQFFQQKDSLIFQNLDPEVKEPAEINKSIRLPISLLYQESSQSQSKSIHQDTPQQQQIKKQQKQTVQIVKDNTQSKNIPTANQMITKQAQLHFADNLLGQNQSIIAKSLKFRKFFSKNQNKHSILQCLINPLEEGTRQIFHLYVFQNFLQKTFQLWLDQQPQNILLLQAKKTIKLQKSQYEISTFMKDINQYIPLCSLISNMDRNQYNLQIEKGEEIMMVATISAHLNFHRNRSFVLYVPTIDKHNGKFQTIIKNEEFSSLRLVFRQKENPNVTYSSSEKFGLHEQKIFQKFGLRQSKKNVLYRDKKEFISFIFGRKGQNSYIIVSGGGYSPIQILSLAITNIQAL